MLHPVVPPAKAAKWRPAKTKRRRARPDCKVVFASESATAHAHYKENHIFFTRWDAAALKHDLNVPFAAEERRARGNFRWGKPITEVIPKRWRVEHNRTVVCRTASTGRFVFAVVRADTGGDANRMPDSVLAQMKHVRWQTFRKSVPGVDMGYWGHAESYRVAPFVGFGKFRTKPRACEETVNAYMEWREPAATALFHTSCSAADIGYDPRKATVATTAGYMCGTHCDVDAPGALTAMRSDVGTHVKGHELVFPSLEIVVALNDGDVIVWDGTFPHCTAEGRIVEPEHPEQLADVRTPRTRVGTRAYTSDDRPCLRHAMWLNKSTGSAHRKRRREERDKRVADAVQRRARLGLRPPHPATAAATLPQPPAKKTKARA